MPSASPARHAASAARRPGRRSVRPERTSSSLRTISHPFAPGGAVDGVALDVEAGTVATALTGCDAEVCDEWASHVRTGTVH